MKKTINITQKSVSIICALVLFAAVFKWPIEYYTLLRLIVFTGAVLTIVFNYKLVFVLVTFCFMGNTFQPNIPNVSVYKVILDTSGCTCWDLVSANWFFEVNTQRENEETIQTNKGRSFKRDKIY